MAGIRYSNFTPPQFENQESFIFLLVLCKMEQSILRPLHNIFTAAYSLLHVLPLTY